ncbi:major facilitator superfamily transporter [Colletotrichum tamarilloi]|uniref:Major facilitator superfamily transporter n=1 Tax=Colletotrichum tamarilloi TaxID=1209934 RepID=A0ABQ9QRH6_9PEZI|nr:major facilitator superfamily transporter [Colletotrichum tamarilloi]KAK1482257.1 major facilitator superfamily transporter [Colletotrichum tamarilloi]
MMAEVTKSTDIKGLHKNGSLNDEETGGSHSEAPLEVHADEDIVARMNNLDPPVTPEEERRVRRKIDMRLPPFLLILYMFTWLDRGALGNAALMGIKEDLGFTSRDFSLAVSMFFVGTAISDLFTNIGMRYIRPSVYLATAMIIWGIFATLQAVAGGPSGMFAIRFFLGIFEAAFISGAPYLTTVLYPRAEWGRRISVYLSATPLAGAFGGWVAYGVSNISNPLIKHWQALFVIEGLVTILFGVACIWVLPDRPHNTHWLTPRERDVATWRMMRDGNRTHGKVHWRTTAAQLTGDWRLWLNIAIYMGQVLQTYTIATFTPIIVATFGYDNVKAQLMTAPPYCVAFVMVFVVGWASDRLQWCSSRPGQPLAVQSLYIGAKVEGASSRLRNEDGLALTASEMTFLQAAADRFGLCLTTGVGFPARYDALTDIRLGKNTLGTFDATGEDDPYSGSSDARRLLESAPRRETVHLDFFVGNHQEWSAMDWSSVRNLHLRQLESDDIRVTDLSTFSHSIRRPRGLDCSGDDGTLPEPRTAQVYLKHSLRGQSSKGCHQRHAGCMFPRTTHFKETDNTITQSGSTTLAGWMVHSVRVFEDGNLPNLEWLVIPAFECPHGQQCLSTPKNELNKGFVQKFPTPSSLETDVAIVVCKVSRNVREGLFMLLTSGLPCSMEFDDLRCKVEMQPGHSPSLSASELQVKLIPSAN